MKTSLPPISKFVTILFTAVAYLTAPALFSSPLMGEQSLVSGVEAGILAYRNFPKGQNFLWSLDLQETLRFPGKWSVASLLSTGLSTTGSTGTAYLYRSSIYCGLSPLVGYTIASDNLGLLRILAGPEFRTWLYYREEAYTYGLGLRGVVQYLIYPGVSSQGVLFSLPISFQIRGDTTWSLGIGLSLGISREGRE